MDHGTTTKHRVIMRYVALIAAAGSGERCGVAVPKQYCDIAGKMMVIWSLEAFISHPQIHKVALTVNPEHKQWYQAIMELIPDVMIVEGGGVRQESVSKGLAALSLSMGAVSSSDVGVLIHDAARPFISQSIISRVIQALEGGADAVDVGVNISDTLKTKVGQDIVDRNSLYGTQTPQGFNLSKIIALHQNNAINQAITDDICMAINEGMIVPVIEGDAYNFKVTTKHDMLIAKALAKSLMERKEDETK